MLRRLLNRRRKSRILLLLLAFFCLLALRAIFPIVSPGNFQIATENERERWLRYIPPVQSGVTKLGRRFHLNTTSSNQINADYVTMTSLLRHSYVILTSNTVQKFAIVTAANSAFYTYALGAIATIQRHLPNHPVVFYDLENSQGFDNSKKFSELCGVRYRSFNFTRYPDHVRQLRNYAWKPLITTDLLAEYPGVLWVDSSIRFVTNNFSIVLERALHSDGMLALTSTGHSNFAVTHPQMYDFLPTSVDGMVNTDQHEANCLLLYRTREAVENVLWWWRLCALDPLCIAPISRTHCLLPYKSRSVHAKCHRFDQSALNILLANYFAYDYIRYFGSQHVVDVMRAHVSQLNVSVCRPHSAPSVAKVDKYLIS